MHQQAESKLGIMTEKNIYVKDTNEWTYLNDRAKFQLLKIDSEMKETQKFIDMVKPRGIKILHQYTKIVTKIEKIQYNIEVIGEEIYKMEAEIKVLHYFEKKIL